MTVTLSVENATARFGETVALNAISLTLDKPGIHGLLGRNGSGKTTLFSLIAGLRKPHSGHVRLDGEEVFENHRATARICLIRESGDTVESGERIADGLKFAAEMRPYWDADYAGALLDRFGLSEKNKIGALSRGQRAKFACTLGLAARAPLTLFDEAYLGMDAPSRYAFYDLLLEDFLAHPRLIVLSSHHIEEVSRLFEGIVIIDEGKLVLHEPADALRGRGVTLTGPAAAVDGLLDGARVLSTRSLGPTKAVAVYGATDILAENAARAGVEMSPLSIQDIFVHMTEKGGKP